MGNKSKGAPKGGITAPKGRATVKKKSIKSRALDINSKRRVRRAGSMRKAGVEGEAIRYITRQRAMKKLQLTLKDFRRLCILKGIYPREPRKKRTTKTVYHVKDIAFLAHEPLLRQFAEKKAFMKRVYRHVHRLDEKEAMRLYDQRPTYTLDHIIKERYPRFIDSLADMDDALCLVHLFATMHSKSVIRTERIANCLRLSREWQLYVVRSRSLRKTFVSVKGIYYQAEVMGQSITWIVPHKFAQNTPREVDFRVMASFLEFYESLVGFVLFKLYHTLGLRYPPKLDAALDAAGAHLAVVQEERLAEPEADDSLDDDEDDGEDSDMEEDAPSETPKDNKRKGKKKSKADIEADESEQQELSKKRIASLASKMHEIVQSDKARNEEAEGAETSAAAEVDGPAEDEVFGDDEQVQQIAQNERAEEARTNLLRGHTLWLSREVPFEPLEFVIRSFGGVTLSANNGDSPKDPRVTHIITDRPKVTRDNKRAEYVQPQWVFDSVNWRVLMPVQRYAPDAELPPHLSPFVDNDVVGYKPEFAEEIEALQSAAGVPLEEVTPSTLHRDIAAKKLAAEEGAPDDDAPADDALARREARQEAFVNELTEELATGQRRKKKRKRSADAVASSIVASATSETDKAQTATSEGSDKEESSMDEAQNEDEEEKEDDEEAKATSPPPAKKKRTAKAPSGEPQPAAAKSAKKSKAKAKAKATEDTAPKTFIASKRFRGARDGMIFKKGSKGVGYYLDVNKNQKITYRPSKVVSKRQQRLQAKRDEEQRGLMLMSKKSKRLYGKMQHGIKAKKQAADELRRRRRR